MDLIITRFTLIMCEITVPYRVEIFYFCFIFSVAVALILL